MKYLKRIYNYCTKTLFRKALSILLVILILLSSIKFVFLKPNIVLADSLFTFNEGYGTSINDNNGNVGAGTIANAVWKQEDLCKEGKCLYFDGTGDKITFADDADLDFVAADNFTLEGWFRTPDITSGQRTLIAKYNATAGGYKVYMDSSGYLIFGVDDDSTWTPDDSVSTTTTAFDDNKWHFFSAVKTGTTSITIYVDNIQYQTDSSIAATGTLANADSLLIGIDGDGSSNGFSGFIDGVKIYRSARTTAEIKTDYLGETPSRGVTASFGPDTSYISNGLIGYWKMDEASGNPVDSSGNGLTLTNNATTTFVSGKFGNGSEHVPASSQYFSTATAINGVKSVSFWTNPDSTTNYFVGLTSGAYIAASSGTISATGFTNPTIYVNGAISTTLTQDVWQLVTITSETSINADLFYLGKQGSNYYDGTLDEVRVYNRALSPAEVQKLYNWAPGPVGYWDFNENNGTITAFDKSGNANDLTMGSEGSPTTRVSDTFTETSDTEITSHTPDTGTGWSGIQNNITCTQPSGAATSPVVQASTDTAKICVGSTIVDAGQWTSAQPDPTSVTQTITTTLSNIDTSTADRTVGIFGRRTDNDNAYVVYMYPNGHANDSVNLYKIVSGTATSLGSYDATLANGTIIKLEITDSAKKVYVDGIERISSADNSLTSIGTWGLGFGRWQGTSATILAGNATFNWRLDNFLVEDTPSASQPTWITGKFGSGLTFSGSDQQLIRADDSDFDFADDENMTTTTWFKHTTASAQEIILSKFNEAGYKIIMEADGDITCGLDYDSTWSPTDSATSTLATYDDGNWHHIACVKDGATSLSLYIDGVLITTDSSLAATNTLTNADPIYIGIDADGTSNDFTGSLDDIKIYRYVRNQSQVIEDMNAGHPTPGSPIGSSVAYWKFDEGYGTTANDNSINGNALTLSTASWTNSGKFGKAWNGTGALWLSKTNDADLDFAATEDFTLSGWFKSDSANNPTNGTEYIISTSTGNTDVGYQVYAKTDGTICFGIDDDGTWTDVESCTTTDYYDNAWHHFVGVRNVTTDTTKIYIDAVEKDSDNDPTTGTLDGDNVFYIGDFDGDNNATAGTEEFAGDIDEVKIFRSALTADAIKVLYNQSSGQSMGSLTTDSSNNPSNSDTDSYCPPGEGVTCTAPKLEWKLDENTGTSNYDSSGNGATGVWTGTPLWVGGVQGSALNFNGTSDSLKYTPTTWNGSSTGWTVSLWVKADVTGQSQYSSAFASSDAGSTANSFQIDVGGGAGCSGMYRLYGVENTGGATFSVCFDTYNTSWTHLLVTLTTGGTVTTYMNGIFKNQSTPTNGFTGSFSLYKLGASRSDGNFFNGTIDHVKVYDRVLTQPEIAWDMNRGGPVAYWKMDENTGTDANDSSGFGNTGTLTNTPTWTTGKFNYATSFAGSNQHITKSDPTNGSLDFVASEPFTISTWFKHNTASATETLVTKMVTSDNDGGYKLKMEADGDITCETEDDDADTTIDDTATTTAANYDDNVWHHVACVYDITNTDLYIYIDGVLAATDSSITTNSLANDDALFIGIDSATGTEDWIGQIDDTRIYRYPLSIQQIKTIMNNGSAVKF